MYEQETARLTRNGDFLRSALHSCSRLSGPCLEVASCAPDNTITQTSMFVSRVYATGSYAAMGNQARKHHICEDIGFSSLYSYDLIWLRMIQNKIHNSPVG